MRDLHSKIKVLTHLAAAAFTATQTPSNGIDLKGFDAAEFLISIGIVTAAGTGTWSFKLQESDDDSTFTDVTNSDDVLVGSALSPLVAPDSTTGVFLLVDAAAEDEKTYRVGYIGNKRYVRVVSTAASTPGSTPLSIVAVLGNPDLRPTSD